MTRGTTWALAVLTAALATAWVAVPVWLLQPFAPQTDSAVAWSWQLRRAAPLVTAVLAVVVLGLAARLWRARVLARLALVVLVATSAGAAWFARQNHFEWMFRPIPDARFLAATEAHGVAPDEPVIGVSAGTAALAFPITRIGYHHLVNTTLGDVPIVATY